MTPKMMSMTKSKLKRTETLFKRSVQKSDAGIQTDQSSQRLLSAKKTVKLGNETSCSQLGGLGGNLQIEPKPTQPVDPDCYRSDWEDSHIFKKAMRTEATKRGKTIGSEFDITEYSDSKLEYTQTVNDT